jgi:FkbM family methyltransferase
MNIKKTVRSVLLAIAPTFTYPILRKIVTSPLALFLERNTPLSFFSPNWNEIKSGPFKGISVYYDASSNFWTGEAVNGMHDSEIFDFVLKRKLKGKTIFDIGAHIGFNSLCFAKIVGKKGKVVAFEPNAFNRKRMILNLNHNPNLSQIIIVSSIAISNKNGEDVFYFSNAIEDGTSSGSAIGSATDKQRKELYEQYRFEKTKVQTSTLDKYVEDFGYKPDLIKIDVEGAETLVLDGAMRVLKKFKPVFLIELHSILNGHTVTEILSKNSYLFTTLRVENDGRTFIAAVAK